MQRASAAAEQHIPPTKSQAFFKGTANTCHGLKPRDTSEVRALKNALMHCQAQLACSLPAWMAVFSSNMLVMLSGVPKWPVVKCVGSVTLEKCCIL